MIIVQGSREHLDVDEITKEVEKLSSCAGHVFKGIVVKKGHPKVLSIFTLASAPELEASLCAGSKGHARREGEEGQGQETVGRRIRSHRRYGRNLLNSQMLNLRYIMA